MKTVEDLLMQMEEHSSYRIDIHPPADAKAISEMKKNYPFVPSQVLDFYRVTDGVEIGAGNRGLSCEEGTALYGWKRGIFTVAGNWSYVIRRSDCCYSRWQDCFA